MATPTDSAFKFSSVDDLVPGTGPYLDTSRIQVVGEPLTKHSYKWGTQDEGVLMPQPRIRQFIKLNQNNPDGTPLLSYTYPAPLCGMGLPAGVPATCVDDYRYWPAFRTDPVITTTINKFVINETAAVGCGRWSNINKVGSDEGDWLGDTNRFEYIMSNFSNPGFNMTDDTHENSVAGWGFGIDEFNAPADNYIDAFRKNYAPGYFAGCTSSVGVNFKGTQRNARYVMDNWGYPWNPANRGEYANISYLKDGYGSSVCGRVLPAGGTISNAIYYWGGLKHTDYQLAGAVNHDLGYNWKNPDTDDHWVEADICNLDSGLTGGIDPRPNRINRNLHCFRCLHGRTENPDDTDSYYLDVDELCQQHSVCNEGDDLGGTYFLNESLFYHMADISTEL